MSLRRYTDLLSRISLILLFLYALILGANTRGILIPEVRILTLWLLVLVIVIWQLVRWKLHWSWHYSTLDLIVAVWGLALILSFLSNLAYARAILISMWYTVIYIAIAYILLDLLANRAISRENLVKIFLLVGALIIVFGYIQFVLHLSAGRGLDLRFAFNARSLFINSNALATFLIIYLILLLGQIAETRLPILRMILLVYFGLCGFLMFLTSSRSAWLATAVGIAVWLVLFLSHHGVVSFSKMLNQWQRANRSLRMSLSIVGLAGLGILGLSFYYITFEDIEYTLSTRSQLLSAALTMFSEKPLTGHGLSSFGWHITRFRYLPPNYPLKNAHNFPANVAAELGTVGLAALLIVVLIIVRTLIRNWRNTQGRDQAVLTMVIAAAAGYGVHHIFDLTSAAPIIAICGTALLVIILAPNKPVPIGVTSIAVGKGIAVLTIWIVALLTGIWDSQVNLDYMSVLEKVFIEQQYSEAANDMQAITDADPSMVVYLAQQAYLWGLAAHEGDAEARQLAIDAYERVIKIVPYYSPYYANLAALYWTAGQREKSLRMWQETIELAPNTWQMHYNLASVAEAQNMPALAAKHYAEVLRLEPDADLHPAWSETSLRRSTRTPFEDRSPLGRVVLLIEEGKLANASNFWSANDSFENENIYEVVWVLISLAEGDHAAAESHFARAQAYAHKQGADILLPIAEAELARHNGNENHARNLYHSGHELVKFNINTFDGQFRGADIAFYQFYRQVIVRQFLPQVFFPDVEPIIIYRLLANG